MDEKRAKKALREVAKREGVSVRAVYKSIRDAAHAARENPDPRIQAFGGLFRTKEKFPPQRRLWHTWRIWFRNRSRLLYSAVHSSEILLILFPLSSIWKTRTRRMCADTVY